MNEYTTEQVEIYFEEIPEYVGMTQVVPGFAAHLSAWLTGKKQDGWRFLGFVNSMEGSLCMFERINK